MLLLQNHKVQHALYIIFMKIVLNSFFGMIFS